LTELLVALAVFSLLMASIGLVFMQATRSTRQGYQALAAFEESTGVLALIERDLMSAFTSREHGDYYSLTGTPIGMSFVGMARYTTDAGDVNLSRVTYVVYGSLNTGQFIDVDGNDVLTYSLIRYVEPGVSDLNSFPIDWYALPLLLVDNVDPAASPGLQSEIEAFQVDGVVVFGAPWEMTFSVEAVSRLDARRREAFSAKQREWWIRMLGGEPGFLGELTLVSSPVTGQPYTDLNGDGNVDIWDVWAEDGILETDESWMDYVIAENIKVDRKDGDPTIVTPPVWDNRTDFEPFFRYGRMGKNGIPDLDEYWFTEDAIIPEGIIGAIPHLPEAVELRFTMMLESPYPGAPDFDRTFKKLVDIPTAYIRVKP